MKKLTILLIVILCVIVTGCRSNKNNSTKKTTSPKKEINLELGSESYTFKSSSEDCGEHTIQSSVVFSNEKDEDGNLKGTYEFYECHEDNVNLQKATGTYQVDDLDVIFTDSYGQEYNFEITEDDTIVLKEGSETIETFTK